MNLNKPLAIRVKATMITDLHYTGAISLQDLIDDGYLSESEVGDQTSIEVALYQYARQLDGGEFVEKEGISGGWTIDSAQFTQQ